MHIVGESSRTIERLLRAALEPSPLLPTVPSPLAAMTTPPTVTKGTANAGSTITNVDAIVAPTDARFRYLGATPTVSGIYVRAESWALGAPSQAVWGVEFGSDSDMLDLVLSGPATNVYWLWVDGQPVALHGTAGPGSTSQRFRYLVDFTSAGGQAQRRFTLYMDASTYFGGVDVATDDTVSDPDWFVGPKVAFVGDSFIGGSNQETDVFSGYAVVLSRLMGWRDVRHAGQGGTGYLNPGTGGKMKYRDRIAYDVPTDADIVFGTGSVNDGGYGSTAIATEVAAWLTAAKARAPQATFVMILPFEFTSTPASTTLDARTGVINGIAAAGGADLVIDPYTDFRFNTVNAARYRGSDVHPTDAGNEYMARMCAAKLRAWMRAAASPPVGGGSGQSAVIVSGPNRYGIG